jgi:hypothetical protein
MSVEQVRKAGTGTAALFIVKNEAGKVIGLLEKYRDTRHETHPWKAFIGVGMNAKYLGAHYGPTGKKDALNAVLAAV